MKNLKKSAAIITAGFSLALASSISAQAVGEPQRANEAPPGLIKALSKAMPGIQKALIATEGSNSRLQDLPVSV